MYHKILENLLQKGPEMKDKIDLADASQFLDVFRMFQKNPKEISNEGIVSGPFSYKIFDSTGVKGDSLLKCCEAYGVKLDREAYDQHFAKVKAASKKDSLLNDVKLGSTLDKTNDSSKYYYKKTEKNGQKTNYEFPIVQAKVLDVIETESDEIAVLLNKTCCYGESGGQVGDIGQMTSVDGQKLMTITDTKLSSDGQHVWHFGHLEADRKISRETRVKVNFNVNHRIKLMQNHTGTHLLNSVLRQLFPFFQQKSSHVTPFGFKFDFVSLKTPVDAEMVMEIEQRISMYIGQSAEVERLTFPNPESTFENDSTLKQILETKFPDKHIITLSDESYPSQVSVICLPDSVEPCCGTHVNNTADVQDLVIVSVRGTHPGHKSIKCLTGSAAMKSRETGIALVDVAIELNEKLEACPEGPELESIRQGILEVKKKIQKNSEKLPFYVKEELGQMLDEMTGYVNKLDHAESSEVLLESNEELIVGQIDKSWSTKRITKKLTSKTFLILVPRGKGQMIAVANVPKELKTERFDAEKWLRTVLKDFPVTVKKYKDDTFVTELFEVPADKETILNNALSLSKKHIEL